MDRVEVQQFANEQIDKWGLKTNGWTFTIKDRSTTKTLATCYYNRKQIIATGWYIDHNEKPQVHDTVLHEIAHALAGPAAGHGPIWQEWAIRVGASPNRFKDPRSIVRRTGKYLATCDSCKQSYQSDGVPRRGRMCPCTKSLVVRPLLLYRKVRPSMVAPSSHVLHAALHAAQQIGRLPEVDVLLNELTRADKVNAKRIRSKLRRLGHKGGLA